MYLRHSTVTKSGKTHTYWRLVRAVRVGRKVRQETVAQLGELDAKGRIAARHLADSIVGLERQPGFFEEELPTEPVTVVPSRLRLERGRRFGDVWLAWKLWQALGLDTWLEVVTASPAVGKFLMMNPVSVLGAESEGAAGVITVNSSVKVPVYLVGPGVPQTGDLLVCRFVDYRWVTQRRTPTSHPGSGACTGYLVPITPSFVYFACPNGGFGGNRVSLPMTQATPACGLGPFPVYPLGGGFPNHHVTLSAQAWYTPAPDPARSQSPTPRVAHSFTDRPRI